MIISMLLALELISYTPSESLYCSELKYIRYVWNQCFNKGQHPMRHQGLFKFLSCLFPDSCVGARGLVKSDLIPF